MRASLLRILRPSLLAAAFVFAGIWTASACSACYGGKSDSSLAQGMNWGIMTLLGVILAVLAGVATFFVFLARKAAALEPTAVEAETAVPSHVS